MTYSRPIEQHEEALRAMPLLHRTFLERHGERLAQGVFIALIVGTCIAVMWWAW
jgi:hypothetical protein